MLESRDSGTGFGTGTGSGVIQERTGTGTGGQIERVDSPHVHLFIRKPYAEHYPCQGSPTYCDWRKGAQRGKFGKLEPRAGG